MSLKEKFIKYLFCITHFLLLGFFIPLFSVSAADNSTIELLEETNGEEIPPHEFIVPTETSKSTYEAVIQEILEEGTLNLNGQDQEYQELKCEITKGDKKGDLVTVDNGKFSMGNVIQYKKGDRVYLSPSVNINGDETFFITGYVRTNGILILFVMFVAVAILIASKNGATSLISMLLSFLVILKFILPRIVDGGNPVLIVLLASIFLIPVTFYISHGFNKKSTVAILGTFLAFVITCILAQIAVNITNLTGYASEEAMFLQGLNGTEYDIKGIFLAGIIVGLLGVLDDITVAQVSVVYQLNELDNSLEYGNLYRRSMDIGKNHIASMINTLILVSAGASLPLLLLFIDDSIDFIEAINYEVVTSEIVNTLVGSIGLILAVPITTLLACYFVKKKNEIKII